MAIEPDDETFQWETRLCENIIWGYLNDIFDDLLNSRWWELLCKKNWFDFDLYRNVEKYGALTSNSGVPHGHDAGAFA